MLEKVGAKGEILTSACEREKECSSQPTGEERGTRFIRRHDTRGRNTVSFRVASASASASACQGRGGRRVMNETAQI